VFCFVLQRTPPNENNSGTGWQGIKQLLILPAFAQVLRSLKSICSSSHGKLGLTAEYPATYFHFYLHLQALRYEANEIRAPLISFSPSIFGTREKWARAKKVGPNTKTSFARPEFLRSLATQANAECHATQRVTFGKER